MLKQFNLLNIILASLITLMGSNVYKIISKPVDYSKFSTQTSQKNKNRGIDKETDILNTEKIFPSFYDAVVEKNIFRPERTEWKAPPPPPPPPPQEKKEVIPIEIVRPDIALKGVILLDDGRRVAIVEGTYTKFKKVAVITHHVSGGPTKKIKQVEVKKALKDHRLYIDDLIGQYRVTSILHDRLILTDHLGGNLPIFLKKEDQKKEEETDTVIKRADGIDGNGTFEKDGTMYINIVGQPESTPKTKTASSPAPSGTRSSPAVIKGSGGAAGSIDGGGKTAGKIVDSDTPKQHLSGN